MVVTVFALAGAAVWAVLGAVLGGLPLGTAALVVAIGYALVYGLAETARFPINRFGLRAQVPSSWIRGRGRSVQVAVWGLLLAPGVLTHNQFAGIWLVPMMVAVSGGTGRGLVVGALAGATHGLARALGILRLMPRLARWEQPGAIVLAQFRWKTIDGVALTLAGGLLLASVAL
jgi:hypothetical protein